MICRTLFLSGSKVTLWCVGTVDSTSAVEQRSLDSSDASKELEPPSKKGRVSSIDVFKACTKEYESKLKEKHEDTYTPFWYKL